MVTLLIDGKQAALRTVGTNDGLGYGRLDRPPGLEVHGYELFVGRDDLVARMGGEYEALVAEMKVDDLRDDEPSALMRMGYPTMADAFEHPDDFQEVIRIFLHRDILVAFVPFSEESVLVINSTDRILVSEAGVTLTGRCFRCRRPATTT